MPDMEKVISWVEGLAEDDWRLFHSDSEVQNIAKAVLALLKEQEQEEEKIPEYPCKNCCSPFERAACCGCEKERQWQTKYGKQKGQ